MGQPQAAASSSVVGETLGVLGGQTVAVRLVEQLNDLGVGQGTQHPHRAAQRPQRLLLRAGAGHSQHTAGQLLHGLGQPQGALLGDEPPHKGDEVAVRRHLQFLPQG